MGTGPLLRLIDVDLFYAKIVVIKADVIHHDKNLYPTTIFICRKFRIKAPKFPLLQLLMATLLHMLTVDSSKSFPSELEKIKMLLLSHNKYIDLT